MLGEFVCICTRMLKNVMQVWFTVQDALQFADGGVSAEWAKKYLTALVNKHGAPVGFHRGRWKPLDGPREGGAGKWSAGFTTLKDFMQTQSQLARQSASVGGAGARSLATHVHLQVCDLQPQNNADVYVCLGMTALVKKVAVCSRICAAPVVFSTCF